MKNTCLLAACLFLAVHFLQAQCPTGPLHLTTQAMVDSFKTNYPGCTELPVDLSISGNLILNLDSLEGLSKIKGALTVNNCSSLEGLIGLDNLQTVEGNLSITYNSQLGSLAGLSKLNKIKGNLLVEFNNSMTSFFGLEALTDLDNDLWIGHNPGLLSIAMNQLQYVGGKMGIIDNAALLSFQGLNSLSFINSDFRIDKNPNIQNFIGLGNLEFIGNHFWVNNNEYLENFLGLEKLSTVTKDFRITYNSGLSDFKGLSSLTQIGGVTNVESNGIDSLAGLTSLTTFGGPVTFYGNSQLSILDGPNNLTSLFGDLLIQSNNQLKSIHGFSKLTHLNGSLTIRFNDQLNEIDAFPNLHSTGASLFVDNNYSLKQISGFNRLKSIDGSFYFYSNNQMKELADFDSLKIIGGDLLFSGSPQLDVVKAFNRLETIGKSFRLYNNSKLASLDFLPNLGFVGHQIWITNNPKLASCEAIAFCDKLLNFPDSVTVFGNAPGCADKNDLASSCTGTHSYVSGRAWADLNCDSIFNSFDVNLGNRIIRRLDDYPFATTNPNGKFTKLLQAGGPAQSFKLPVLPGFQSLPMSRQVKSLVFSDSFPNQDFRLCPDGEATNLCLSVASSGSPRPGFSTTYTICMANIGNTVAAGSIIFDMTDPFFKNWVADLTASDNPINTGSVLIWNTDSISPFSSVCVSVTIKWVTTMPLGEYVTIQVNLNPINAVDIDYNNNIVPLRTLTVGSYDPNDKTVNIPVVGLNNFTTSAQLDYQIRFQNTGNFPASFIEVIDTLPYLLDSRTIEMIGSSHPYSLEFPAQNVLKWRFDDINLPDSTSDEPGSHGWLLFRIKTHSDLLPTDTIRNRCGIYFDFNAPVLTGFAKTWFSKEIVGTTDFSTSLKLTAFPNPTEENTIVQFTLDKPAAVEFQLFDYAGKLIETFPEKPFSAGLQTVPVSLREQPSGVYFLEMKTGSGRAVFPIVRR